MIDVDLYTKKQLSEKFHKKIDTIIKILEGISPDGMKGRYCGWSESTFKKAEGEYLKSKDFNPFDYSNQNSSITDPDLERKKLEMDILWKTEQAKKLKLENMEKENFLVSRDEVEDLLCYQSQLFADKLKAQCRDK